MSPVNQAPIRVKRANEYSLLKSEKANAWNKKKELGRIFLRVHFFSFKTKFVEDNLHTIICNHFMCTVR